MLIVKLFHFFCLPRRNNLPASVSNISPAYQMVKCHRGKRNNLFIIHCSRINYMEWHQLLHWPPHQAAEYKLSAVWAQICNRRSTAIPPDCFLRCETWNLQITDSRVRSVNVRNMSVCDTLAKVFVNCNSKCTICKTKRSTFHRL